VPDGFLAVEVGHEQASSVSEVLSEASWDVTRVIRDHGGIDRVLVAKPRR
jgi:methylase of polypeptide subunit release factors